MHKEFNRNMMVMLVAIMAGVVIITFFTADIMRKTQSEEQISSLNTQIESKTAEIKDVKERNINFTNHFLKSSSVLDMAREDRADGNYNFDYAFIMYTTALSEDNETNMNNYKSETVLNCDYSMYNYTNSNMNFKIAGSLYNTTKSFTVYNGYISLLDLYINLSNSGARLTMLRYNASRYLSMLAENITMENNTVTFIANMTVIEDMFDELVNILIPQETGIYEELKKDIQEYDIEGFDPYVR